MTPRLHRGWFYLALTVVFEVIATLALRASDGFTVLVPSLMAVASYATTVVVLAWALQTIPMSLAYVVWTAAGTAGVVLFSIVLFGDRMTPLAWTGIGLVIVGVATINAFPSEQSSEEVMAGGAGEEHAERS